MKFYNSIGPNPRVVRMFMAEKGISIPTQEVNLMKGENREGDHLKRNPHGQMPTLELDSGAFVSEITVICEYLEDKNPKPALIGANAEEKAETRMWTRRMDIKICEPMANGFRYAEGFPLFKDRLRCLPEAAPGLKAVAQDGVEWMENHLTGDWLAGERFTLADIVLFAFMDFGGQVGQPLNPEFKNLGGWFAKVKDRPSAKA